MYSTRRLSWRLPSRHPHTAPKLTSQNVFCTGATYTTPTMALHGWTFGRPELLSYCIIDNMLNHVTVVFLEYGAGGHRSRCCHEGSILSSSRFCWRSNMILFVLLFHWIKQHKMFSCSIQIGNYPQYWMVWVCLYVYVTLQQGKNFLYSVIILHCTS